MKYLAALAACLTLPSFGAVLESDDDGFVSAHEVVVAAAPERVFAALAEETGKWWDPAHTYSGDSSNLELDFIFSETLPRDGYVRHMTVDYVLPGKTLRLSGGLGPLQTLAVAGSMTFELEAADAGTKIVYRYVVNGRQLGDWAVPVDRVMGSQLDRLRRYVETGSPAAQSAPSASTER